jgi:hypothetical protein
MSWTIAQGDDNGDPIIVTINDNFRDNAQRGGRDTSISVRFLGPHMLKSVENRTIFEDHLISALAPYDGVIVAGITHSRPVSYTFLSYCSGNVEPSAIPIDEALRNTCLVRVRHDAEWTEYEKWLPSQVKGLGRVAMFLRSLPFRFSRR